MPVSNTNTFTVSTANGATTVFPYSFTLLSANDLVVKVNGTVVTTGFTVSGIGDAAGGNITFTTAPANGARVLRERVVTLTRSTDYQYVGSLSSAILDADFDRLWLAVQQVNPVSSRALRLPVDSSGSAEISDIVGNAYLRANSAGTGIEWVPGPAISGTTQSNLVTFLPAGTGAVARTVQDKERDIISLADYMTAAQLADVKARTLTVDVSAAINAAVLANPNAIIWAPSGTYKKTTGTTLAASQQIKGAGPTNTIFSCSDAFDAFILSSDYAGVSDCGFTSASARTSKAYVKLSAATRGNFVRRVKMTNAFLGAHIDAEAVISYFEDIEIINTTPGTGTGVLINGGNDTFLSRVVMDAPVGAQPACGVRISRSQAVWMAACDMIRQGRGIQIDPDGATGGLVTWCFFTDVACDLGTGDGLYINPNNATVKGLFFDNCWFSSNLNGINVTKTGTGAVDGLFFDGCTIFNNSNRGAWAQIASNVEFNNCKVSGNSQSLSGTYAGIEFANSVVSFAVRNTRSGAVAGFANTQNYGLLIGTGCDQYVMTDNNFIGNVTAGALDNSQTTSGTREVRGNLGFKTVASGVATMGDGLNQISPAHGLAGAPSVVLTNATNSNLGGLSYWTGNFTATTFNINTSANVVGAKLFSWQASLYN